MAAPKVPQSDAKIGAKIDYIAKHLEAQLKPAGFNRRARVLSRDIGVGVHHCVQLIGLQGDKWNEGSGGKFTVNLGVCFPALLDLQKRLPGLEWISQHANPYDIAFGPGGFEGRLGDALTGERLPEWPDALKARADFWAEIDPGTNLLALAESLHAAIRDLALPWLTRRSTLAAFGDSDLDGFRSPSPRVRMLAAILDGRVDLAQARLSSSSPHQLADSEPQLRALLALAKEHGLDAGEVAWSTPPAHPMVERRAAEIELLKSGHVAAIQQYLQNGSSLSGHENEFLDAWVHESAAHQFADSVHGFRLWKLAAEATQKQRRTLLLRLLERLPEPGPTVESTEANVWATYPHYHRNAWHKLASALLAHDQGPCEAAHAAALLDALSTTVTLVTEDLVNDEFKAPVSTTVKWLEQHATPASRFAAKAAMQRLLDAIRTATIARSHARLSRAPSRELLGDELADQVAALFSPESVADFERLYTEHPERSYAGDDRDAIKQIKRWLRADASGQVPLQIESDDWGLQLTDALGELDPESRGSMHAILQWFDGTAVAKPSKRWINELDARCAALPGAEILTWLSRTLPRFATTGLRHFMATPGYLAWPGETSERVLIGLVHWAGRIGGTASVTALEDVAAAAFTVVPDQRMRCYSVGSACLTALAGHAEGQLALKRLRQAMKQKNVKAAIDKALEGK